MEAMNVTTIAPKDRHPLIFKTFDNLKNGESFVLINDHDPRPLYYSFLHERADQFDWEYLEQGPIVWKVKITRKHADWTQSNIAAREPVLAIAASLIQKYNEFDVGDLW